MEGARTRTQQSESLWLTVGAEEGSSRFEAWTRQEEDKINSTNGLSTNSVKTKTCGSKNSTRTFFIDNFNRKKVDEILFDDFRFPVSS